MGDSFKKVAQSGGKCVVCFQPYNSGTELIMQNIGDDTNKNWLVSPHQDCFNRLKQDPSLKAKGLEELKKQGGGQKKFRTAEERTKEATDAIDVLWTKAVERATSAIKTAYGQDPTTSAMKKEVLILAEVFLKSMAWVYSR